MFPLKPELSEFKEPTLLLTPSHDSRSGRKESPGKWAACWGATLMLASALSACQQASDSGTSRALGAAADEPLRTEQWWLDQIGTDAAHARATGAGVVVAVLGVGVYGEHPDFQRSDGTPKSVAGMTILRPETEIYEALHPEPRSETCTLMDCGAGDGTPTTSEFPYTTAMASIIAAEANGYGMLGVAPRAQIMSVAVFQNNASNVYDQADGIRWAVDHGAQVIVLAGNGPVAYELAANEGLVTDFEFNAAIDYARARHVVVVGSAGTKENAPTCGFSGQPNGALCVTATGRDELPALGSSLGVRPDMQVLAAPGGHLSNAFAKLPGPAQAPAAAAFCSDALFGAGFTAERADLNQYLGCTAPSEDGLHVPLANTTAAVAVVAGVAALLVELGCNDQQTIDLLLATARVPGIGQSPGYLPAYGHGIVDADAATTAALEVCR